VLLLADSASRQIDVAKLRDVALAFELTMDIDALHREADLDRSGESENTAQLRKKNFVNALDPFQRMRLIDVPGGVTFEEFMQMLARSSPNPY
jgi:hypothetical protein